MNKTFSICLLLTLFQSHTTLTAEYIARVAKTFNAVEIALGERLDNLFHVSNRTSTTLAPLPVEPPPLEEYTPPIHRETVQPIRPKTDKELDLIRQSVTQWKATQEEQVRLTALKRKLFPHLLSIIQSKREGFDTCHVPEEKKIEP